MDIPIRILRSIRRRGFVGFCRAVRQRLKRRFGQLRMFVGLRSRGRDALKVLWLCNIMTSQMRKLEGLPDGFYGSWITGLHSTLLKLGCVKLTICAPLGGTASMKFVEAYGFSYYLFNSDQAIIHSKYNPNLVEVFKKILNEVKPDIIHIFGTEYLHTFAMVEACRDLSLLHHVVIQVQGLVSIIAKHYFEGVPQDIRFLSASDDTGEHDSLSIQQKKFEFSGDFERRAIGMVSHIIGRTKWDYTCASQINVNAVYHKCDEILRDSFYTHPVWRLKNCTPHSIFISQGDYPIKGLHYAIDAMEILIKVFPDVHLYVAGNNPTDKNMRKSTYANYILKLIKSKKLQPHVTFLGFQTEIQMCEQLVKAHVYVIPSTIENSPNSLGEAGMLGVPRVASYVGGIPDMIRHGIDGFLYHHSAPYMLAGYVGRLFKDDRLAESFSRQSIKSADKIHDREKIVNRLLEIYRVVSA